MGEVVVDLVVLVLLAPVGVSVVPAAESSSHSSIGTLSPRSGFELDPLLPVVVVRVPTCELDVFAGGPPGLVVVESSDCVVEAPTPAAVPAPAPAFGEPFCEVPAVVEPYRA